MAAGWCRYVSFCGGAIMTPAGTNGAASAKQDMWRDSDMTGTLVQDAAGDVSAGLRSVSLARPAQSAPTGDDAADEPLAVAAPASLHSSSANDAIWGGTVA